MDIVSIAGHCAILEIDSEKLNLYSILFPLPQINGTRVRASMHLEHRESREELHLYSILFYFLPQEFLFQECTFFFYFGLRSSLDCTVSCVWKSCSHNRRDFKFSNFEYSLETRTSDSSDDEKMRQLARSN